MYQADSFLTLGWVGRAGVVSLSTILLILCMTAVWKLSAQRRRITALAGASGLFWLFVWLSPQLYYTLYLLLIDGLPGQMVIGPPPRPGHLAQLLTFTGKADLSHHGQGILGWLLVLVALARCGR